MPIITINNDGRIVADIGNPLLIAMIKRDGQIKCWHELAEQEIFVTMERYKLEIMDIH